jgi:hypothetical protein
MSGQELKSVEKSSWGNMNTSGFFSILGKVDSDSPFANNRWWWGINCTYANNVISTQYYNAQIAFEYATNPLQMYVRITDKYGKGEWAKVLHSKGDHAIDGKLTTKEIEIKVDTGADFVFKPDYNLKTLSEVEAFVKENQHLPDIPSEEEMQENGLNLNKMQIKLLQKIEELTLYVIDLKKENESIKKELKELKKE